MSIFHSFLSLASFLLIKVRNNKFWPLQQFRCWLAGAALLLAIALFLLAPLLSCLTQTSANITLADGSVIDTVNCETNYLISPDSNWMVYYAREETSQVYHLYSRPLDGHSDPIRLNGDVVNGDSLPVYCMFNVRISPDSQWVVYLADQDIDGVMELYKRAIDGSGAVIKLSGPGSNVSGAYGSFQISPDSHWLVYVADQIYSRPLAGSGSPIMLSVPLNTEEVQGTDFEIVSDSKHIVYRAYQPVSEKVELYSRPIDGSEMPLRLNAPLVNGGFVWYFKISQDKKWIVYVADQDTDGTDELYSRPLDGSGTVTKINGPLVNGGNVTNFKISPDDKYIVYTADQEKDEANEIYSCPIEGSGSPTKLNGLVTGGSAVRSFHFQISPDSRWVVYWGDQDKADVYTLYSRPLDGSGQPIKLDDVTVGSPNGADYKFQISPDSSRVVYLGYYYLEGNCHVELYVRPIDGHTGSIKLNDPLVPNGNAGDMMISPDGTKVLYLADQDIDMMFEIYSRPITGSGTSLKLNHTLSSGSRVWEMQITPNGQWIVYLASDGLSAGTLPFASVNDPSYLYSRIDDTYMLGRTSLRTVSGYNHSFFLPFIFKND